MAKSDPRPIEKVALHLVELIYEAALDRTRWPSLLEAWRQALDGAALALVLRAPTKTCAAVAYTVGLDPAFDDSYSRYFHTVDPFVPVHGRLPEGEVRFGSEFVPREEFARTEYYNDYLGPQGLLPGPTLGCSLRVTDGLGTAFLGIHRPRGATAIEHERETLCRILAPHLVRAIRFDGVVERALQERRHLLETIDALSVAVFLVSAQSQLRHANSAGERILRASEALRLDRGVLKANKPEKTHTLHSLIRDAAEVTHSIPRFRESALTFERGLEHRPLVGFVMPLARREDLVVQDGPVVAVVVTDPELSVRSRGDALRAVFGLTRAEALLSLELADGRSLDEAAELLGITRETARSRLKPIFMKLGVRKQGELVAVVLRILGPVGPAA